MNNDMKYDSMKNVETSVPGKIMLAGEYSVLNGGQALATTVNKHLSVTLSAASSGSWQSNHPSKLSVTSALLNGGTPTFLDTADRDAVNHWAYSRQPLMQVIGTAIHKWGRVAGSLSVTSTLDAQAGFGSSSAVRLAVLGAFAKLNASAENDGLAHSAVALQRQTQGQASGYDVWTQHRKGTVLFRQNPAEKNPDVLNIAPPCAAFTRIHVYTGGRGARTAPTIQSMSSWLSEDSSRSAALKLANQTLIDKLLSYFLEIEKADESLEEQCFQSWTNLVHAVGGVRRIFQAGPVFPHSIHEAVAASPLACELDDTWSWKTTGAGGEDAILVFAPTTLLDAIDEMMTTCGRVREKDIFNIVRMPQSNATPLNEISKIDNLYTDRRSALLSAEVPSNIALIKYWGKKDPSTQWPANDSLSMTLSEARTITCVGPRGEFLFKPLPPDLDPQALGHDAVHFEGKWLKAEDKKRIKIDQFLVKMRHRFANQFPHAGEGLCIATTNTFPAGCGIASSASGFGALTLALIAYWTESVSFGELAAKGFGSAELAALARLGSGSACRSILGGFVRWFAGESSHQQMVQQVGSANYWPLNDLILVISDQEKTVSSTMGHTSAFTSPLMEIRLAGVGERLKNIQRALMAKDLELLGPLIEAEALEMHSVMLSSTPPARYLLPQTTALLCWIRTQRQQGRLRGWFTLDAGPNIHLLCEPSDRAAILSLLKNDWPDLRVIVDKTGSGPTLTRRKNEAMLDA